MLEIATTNTEQDDRIPAWVDRFPRLWKCMQIKGFHSLSSLIKATPDLEDKYQYFLHMLYGNFDYYTPYFHEKNWHPICFPVAKTLGMHVVDLFPIPEEFHGKSVINPQTIYRSELKRKLKPLLCDAQFKTLTDLASYLGVAPTIVSKILYDRHGDFKLRGQWNEATRDFCEALVTTPEYLFGLPKDVAAKITNLQDMGQEQGTDVPPELAEGFIASKTTDVTIQATIHEEARQTLRQMMLRTLSPREHRVLALRHGFGGSEHTLEEVGVKMGDITRERVRQIETQGT